MTISEKLYYADTTGDYARWIADMTDWWDWTEIDSETTEGETVFRVSATKAVVATMEMSSYNTLVLHLYIEVGGIRTSIAVSNGTGAKPFYVRATKTDTVLCIETAVSTATYTATGTAKLFICEGQNLVTNLAETVFVTGVLSSNAPAGVVFSDEQSIAPSVVAMTCCNSNMNAKITSISKVVCKDSQVLPSDVFVMNTSEFAAPQWCEATLNSINYVCIGYWLVRE